MDIPSHLQALVTQLETLPQDDLKFLNRYIVEQFKQSQASSRASIMAGFAPGDLVSFEDKQGLRIKATVIRTNKNTVSLVTLDEERWNVAPELITLERSHRDQHTQWAEEPMPPTGIKATAQPTTPATANVVSQPSGSATTTTATPAPPTLTGDKTEWIGGMVQAPGMVTGEPGEDYTPSIWLWMSGSSLVIGMDLIDPKEGPHNPVESLQRTIKNPMVETQVAPSHVRVNSKGVAKRLRQAFPSITITCAATPELDAFQQTMKAEIPAKQAPFIYSDIDTDDKTLSYFFNACASLFRYKPWNRLEDSGMLIGVSMEELNIHDAVVRIIGQGGTELGISVFDTIAEYEQSMLVTDAIEYNLPYSYPPGKLLTFHNVKDVDAETVNDIKQHGWNVANTRAYPVLMKVGENLSTPPVTEEDLLLIGNICYSLEQAMDSVHFMRALYGKGDHLVELPAGPFNKNLHIKLQAPFPYDRAMKIAGAADSLMARLLQLDRTWDEDNPAFEKHQILTEQLEKNYRQSPEAQAIDNGPGFSTLIMMLAFNEMNRTIATLTISELDDIVFNIVPQRAMVQPKYAESMIQDARAFFEYLKRMYGYAAADAFIALLDHTAPGRLALALTQSSDFSMGKNALASSGFDPSFDEFLDQPFTASGTTKPKPMDKKSRKKKRSAARKARKKNR